MMSTVEHAEMSRKVRLYFQELDAANTPVFIQVVDVARLISFQFAQERLDEAERRWNAAPHHQYSSDEAKDNELDSCKSAYEFWAKVLQLKTPKGDDYVL